MKNIVPVLFGVKTWRFCLFRVTRTKICSKDSMHKGSFLDKGFLIERCYWHVQRMQEIPASLCYLQFVGWFVWVFWCLICFCKDSAFGRAQGFYWRSKVYKVTLDKLLSWQEQMNCGNVQLWHQRFSNWHSLPKGVDFCWALATAAALWVELCSYRWRLCVYFWYNISGLIAVIVLLWAVLF